MIDLEPVSGTFTVFHVTGPNREQVEGALVPCIYLQAAPAAVFKHVRKMPSMTFTCPLVS